MDRAQDDKDRGPLSAGQGPDESETDPSKIDVTDAAESSEEDRSDAG
ncbi:hypothetical protein OMK64_14500 [Cellulomonas fimi]|nr:hypothetical protein [Cellulomonas fimi]MDC7122743.1 hypothetical protein [Cellulomonas fimi]